MFWGSICRFDSIVVMVKPAALKEEKEKVRGSVRSFDGSVVMVKPVVLKEEKKKVIWGKV